LSQAVDLLDQIVTFGRVERVGVGNLDENAAVVGQPGFEFTLIRRDGRVVGAHLRQ
jgi:hypothetical protein